MGRILKTLGTFAHFGDAETPDAEDDDTQREDRRQAFEVRFARPVKAVEALVKRRHGDAAAKKVVQDLEIMQYDHVRFVSSRFSLLVNPCSRAMQSVRRTGACSTGRSDVTTACLTKSAGSFPCRGTPVRMRPILLRLFAALLTCAQSPRTISAREPCVTHSVFCDAFQHIVFSRLLQRKHSLNH